MKYFRYLIIVALVFLLYRQFKSDVPDLVLLKSLSGQINWVFLIIGFLGLLGSYLVDGFLSQTLLKITDKTLKLKDTLTVAIIDVFASQLLPLGQAGAALTTFYLYKILEVPNNSIVFLIFGWSVSTVSGLLILFLISWFLLPVHPAFGLQLHIWPVVIALMAFIVFIIPDFRKMIIYKILRLLKKMIGDFSIKKSLFGNLKKIKSRKWSFMFCLLLGFLYYIFQASVLYSSFLAFGIQVEIRELFFIQTITLGLSMLSLIPGGLGVTESSLTLGFVFFGYNSARILGGVLLFRIISFWIPLIIGSIVYWQFSRTRGFNLQAGKELSSSKPLLPKDR